MNAPSPKNLPETTGKRQVGSRGPRAPEDRLLPTIGRAYERFLKFPPLVVLATMWMVAVALLVSLALVLYFTA
jgi:hypothetical protein